MKHAQRLTALAPFEIDGHRLEERLQETRCDASTNCAMEADTRHGTVIQGTTVVYSMLLHVKMLSAARGRQLDGSRALYSFASF